MPFHASAHYSGSHWWCDGRGKDHPAFELKILGEINVRSAITVITGGGISGLPTAQILAKRYREEDQSYRINVIDGLEEPFAAASGYNSGVLSYQWFSGELRTCGGYTYKFHEDLAHQNKDFRKKCGYRGQSNFRLSHGAHPSVAGVPKWLYTPNGFYVQADIAGWYSSNM